MVKVQGLGKMAPKYEWPNDHVRQLLAGRECENDVPTYGNSRGTWARHRMAQEFGTKQRPTACMQRP
jgi:hypothetical protein